MGSKIKNNFLHNLKLALTAQGISLLFSILMSLIVPKMLGVEQFSYWQLFIFYSNYVGFFHFGLSDGIYLRYGGTDIEDFSKPHIISQFRLMIVWQLLICLIMIPVLMCTVPNWERGFIWLINGIYLVVANATWYWGYVFQAANKTSVYSTSVILSKAIFIIFVLIMLLIKPNTFIPFILFYVFAQAIALVSVLIKAKDFLFVKQLSLTKTISEAIQNIRIGINLTISNVASNLILGVGRKMVDASAGINSFGMLSLSVSLTSFFLQFISQVSMVMFPALRQINEEKMRHLFLTLRKSVNYLMYLILLGYVPLKAILTLWLPQYKESLYYLMFLLPICVFDGKMQLIFNTYMKVLRKEKSLLLINLCSLILSLILCYIAAFKIKNIVAVAIAMTIAIFIRSWIANIYLSFILKLPYQFTMFSEIGVIILFWIVNIYLKPIVAFGVLFITYSFYIGINYKEILGMVKKFKR